METVKQQQEQYKQRETNYFEQHSLHGTELAHAKAQYAQVHVTRMYMFFSTNIASVTIETIGTSRANQIGSNE